MTSLRNFIANPRDCFLLRYNSRMDFGATNFGRIFEILRRDSSTLSQANTAASRFGHMFIIDAGEEPSGFVGKADGGRLTQNTRYIMLKLQVLRESGGGDIDLGDDKSAETVGNFVSEARTQQSIWINSIAGGADEICPPVQSMAIFRNTEAIGLMSLLEPKIYGSRGAAFMSDPWGYIRGTLGGRPPANSSFMFLKGVLLSYPNASIGIVAMPLITNSTTLREFKRYDTGFNFHGIIVTSDVQKYVVASAIAQVVRLFIQIGVIHADLHGGNVLVAAKDENISTDLVDWGKVFIVRERSDRAYNRRYFTEDMRQTLPTLQKKYFDDYFTVKRDTEDLDNETKRKSLTTERINLLVEARALYILKVMETIRADPRIRDQMARLCDYSIITDRDGKRSYKTTSSVAEIANAFGILVKMMNKVAGGTHQRATLDRYLREGRIVNLEYDINDFIIKPLAIALIS